MTTDAVIVRCPAKVNLSLRILGRRPDRYHEIESIVQAIDLCDELIIQARPADDGVTVTVTAPTDSERRFIDAPRDHRNLCSQAAQALMERTGARFGAHIEMIKHIPTRAGLGGGSSNGAGALVGLNQLCHLGMDRAALAQLAAALGSDVPFFLSGGTALVQGRGERVAPLAAPAPLHFLLALPFDRHAEQLLSRSISEGESEAPRPRYMSTAEAYARLRAHPLLSPPADLSAETRRMIAALEGGDLDPIAAALHNDFEPVVLAAHPDIGQVRDNLIAAGCRGALLAGSGAAVFGLADSREHAEAIAGGLRAPGGWSMAASSDGYVILSVAEQREESR